MTTDMTVEEALEAAATLIEQYGWAQGTMGSRTTGFCMFGALEAVWYPADREYPRFAWDVLQHMRERVGKVLPVNVGIVEWNDDPTRTKEQVILALRSAAANRPTEGEEHGVPENDEGAAGGDPPQEGG